MYIYGGQVARTEMEDTSHVSLSNEGHKDS